MTLKYTDDEARFQAAMRAKRLSMPSAATIVASRVHEDLGRLHAAVTELAQRADRGDKTADRELLSAADDAYELLANVRACLEGVR